MRKKSRNSKRCVCPRSTSIDSLTLLQEHTILSSRVGALQRKLTTEVKIRDAAQNLARLNASSSSTLGSSTRISCQTTTALETAERKVLE